MADSREGTCRGCGAPVLWVRRADTGKWHPVEREPRIGYAVRPESHGYEIRRVHESHFARCPMASSFRRRRG